MSQSNRYTQLRGKNTAHKIESNSLKQLAEFLFRWYEQKKKEEIQS